MYHSPDSRRDENDDFNEISEKITSDGPPRHRRQQKQEPLFQQQDNTSTTARPAGGATTNIGSSSTITATTTASSTITTFSLKHPQNPFDWDCHDALWRVSNAAQSHDHEEGHAYQQRGKHQQKNAPAATASSCKQEEEERKYLVQEFCLAIEQPSSAPILHPPGNHDGHLHNKHLKQPSEDDYCRLLQEWWDRQQQGTTGDQFPPHINFHNNTSKSQTKEVVFPSSSWPNNGQQQDYYSSSPNHQHYDHHQHHQSGKEEEAVSNQFLEPLQHDHQLQHQLQHQRPSSFRPSPATRSIATPTTKDSISDQGTILVTAKATASPLSSGDHQQHITIARYNIIAGAPPPAASTPPPFATASSCFAAIDPLPFQQEHHHQDQQGQDISFNGQEQKCFMNTNSHNGLLDINHDNTYYNSSTMQQENHQGKVNQHFPHNFQNCHPFFPSPEYYYNGYKQHRDHSQQQNSGYFCNARFSSGQKMYNNDPCLHPQDYTNNHTTFPQQEQERIGTRTGFPGPQNQLSPYFVKNTYYDTATNYTDHELNITDKRKCEEQNRIDDKLRPRRPLSAYNFFFTEEKMVVVALLPDPPSTSDNNIRIDAMSAAEIQEYLVKAMEQKEKTSPSELVKVREQNEVATQKILDIHFSGDKEKKSHKKRHGKISFQKLASVIGIRWRHLSDHKKKRYHDFSKKDNDRCKKMDQIYEYGRTSC